ncbi:hypothetical protein BST97_15110 [Nonlabens spongiae]|uniref:Uncharacterized protein n=1 Tax=Nonlabens spongiae TaxID=331648 RepID=A0A1W6MNM2_9FLAO|nr:hypothetical protein BST97_15110 [Nonlabens spongiae]
MRKRVNRPSKSLQKGAIFRSELPGVSGDHVCFLLQDVEDTSIVDCLPVCNLTSNPGNQFDFVLEVSMFHLPDRWFDVKKRASYVVSNLNDCINEWVLKRVNILGNLVQYQPTLWSYICYSIRNNHISDKFNSICDC